MSETRTEISSKTSTPQFRITKREMFFVIIVIAITFVVVGKYVDSSGIEAPFQQMPSAFEQNGKTFFEFHISDQANLPDSIKVGYTLSNDQFYWNKAGRNPAPWEIYDACVLRQNTKDSEYEVIYIDSTPTVFIVDVTGDGVGDIVIDENRELARWGETLRVAQQYSGLSGPASLESPLQIYSVATGQPIKVGQLKRDGLFCDSHDRSTAWIDLKGTGISMLCDFTGKELISYFEFDRQSQNFAKRQCSITLDQEFNIEAAGDDFHGALNPEMK